MQALAEVGALAELTSALRSPSPAARAAAAAVLGVRRAADESQAVPSLQPLLRDADPSVRVESACALAALTRQPVTYTDCLGELREAIP